MALVTVPDWQLATYQTIYAMEKLSGVSISADNTNIDSDLSNPVSGILWSLITTAGMLPSDAQAIAGQYVTWRRTVKDVRQNSPVGTDQPYGYPHSVYNNAGNL